MQTSTPPVASVDEYIAQFPPAVQQILESVRAVIKETAPHAVEKISYRMPAYYQGVNLVYFAGFKNHIGFYPTASGIEAFKNELSTYKWSKGAIQFPLSKPIPYDLIRRITLFRLAETQPGM
jgi:uncharacterized protein YdhG (YjbR/CyaY superfamily)